MQLILNMLYVSTRKLSEEQVQVHVITRPTIPGEIPKILLHKFWENRNSSPECLHSFICCSLNAIAFKFIALPHSSAYFLRIFWNRNQKCLSAGNNSFFLTARTKDQGATRRCLSALFVDIIVAVFVIRYSVIRLLLYFLQLACICT